MAEKNEKMQFRCSKGTKADFKRMLEDIDPLGDQEDSIERIIEVWKSNPSLFRQDYL